LIGATIIKHDLKRESNGFCHVTVLIDYFRLKYFVIIKRFRILLSFDAANEGRLA